MKFVRIPFANPAKTKAIGKVANARPKMALHLKDSGKRVALAANALIATPIDIAIAISVWDFMVQASNPVAAKSVMMATTSQMGVPKSALTTIAKNVIKIIGPDSGDVGAMQIAPSTAAVVICVASLSPAPRSEKRMVAAARTEHISM